jgi:hypothetical protein
MPENAKNIWETSWLHLYLQPAGFLFLMIVIMKNKILFAFCLVAGLMFINSGLDKFLHYIPVPKDLPEKMVKVGTAIILWVIIENRKKYLPMIGE